MQYPLSAFIARSPFDDEKEKKEAYVCIQKFGDKRREQKFENFCSIHSTDVEAFIYIDTHILNHIKSDTQLHTYEHL